MEADTVKTDSEQKIPVKADKSKRRRQVISNDHILKKRAALRLPKNKRDVYVGNKTSIKAYLKLCEKILDSNEKEVILHGLGGAIDRACRVALQLQKNHYGTLELDVKTSTINLTDDLEPKTDDADYEINERQNSAIHIRVFRTALIGALRLESTKVI